MIRLVGLLLGLGLGGLPLAQAQQFPVPSSADRWQRTADYLESLGLSQLQAEWLEARLFAQPAPAPDQQQALARQLMDVYQQQLLGDAEDSGDKPTPDWLARTRTLLTIYPQLKSEATELAIGQARYRRLEQAQARWWREGTPSPAANDLADQWRRLAEDLRLLRQRLQERYEDRLTLLESNLPTSLKQASQLDRWEQQVARASYLLGWSHYWWAIANPGQRMENLRLADQFLRDYLQLEAEVVLLGVDPSWIQWHSDWDVQAMIGLALCQRGLDHPQQSQHVFDLIETHVDQGRVPTQLASWRLRSRLYVQDRRGLGELLEQQAAKPAGHANSRSLFWITAWEGHLALSRRDREVAEQLEAAALAGLARDFQGARIGQLLSESQTAGPGIERDPFLGHWIAGYLALEAMEQPAPELDASQRRQWRNKQRTQAREHLVAALEHPPQQRGTDALVCRFLLAMIEHHEGHWLDAARQWEAVSKAAEQANQLPLAQRSFWASLQARAESARRSSESIPAVLIGLEQLALRFPGSPYQSAAEALRLEMLQRNLPTEQAIQRWRQIPEGDPNYQRAGQQWVSLAYRRWSESLSQGDQATQSQLQTLRQAAEEVLPRWPAGSDPALDTRLQVAQAWVQTKGADDGELDRWLEPVQEVLGQRSDSDPLAARWRWVNCLRQANRGEFVAAGQSLDWLQDNAEDESLIRSAGLALARELETVRQSAGDLSEEHHQTALTVYTQLSEQMGDSDEALEASTNARIVSQRLAESLEATGQYDSAGERWAQLQRLFPQRKDYLHRLASIRQRQRQWETAGELWQQLASAEPAGSQAWLEARMGQLDCLLGGGERAAAERLMRQSAIFVETIPPSLESDWKRLQQELSGDGDKG